MSKSIQICLVALVAVLLICAVPFFTRLSFGTHETADRQPIPVASRTHAADTVVPTASPVPEPTESGAEQARRKRLKADDQQLKQANAALEDARQQAEADKKRAEKAAEGMAELNGKLLDASLKVPRTASEAAALMGQNLSAETKFKQKWGDNPPAVGTPEADEYAKEKDALVTQSAALLKFLSDGKNASLLARPDSVAQFQATSLVGAIGLRDDQAQSVNTALDGYYQQFFTQGLNEEDRPETGIDAWQLQRFALSKQAYAAVTTLLTPEQAAAFHNIYPTPTLYMLQMTFGGLPGLTVSH